MVNPIYVKRWHDGELYAAHNVYDVWNVLSCGDNLRRDLHRYFDAHPGAFAKCAARQTINGHWEVDIEHGNVCNTA